MIEIFFPAPPGLPVPVSPPPGEDGIRKMIHDTDWKTLCNVRDDDAVRTGALWLHGFLEEAHKLAQQNGSPEGSYWHALVHRSEGDFDNSKYWFGRLGKYALFPQLRSEIEKILRDEGRTSDAALKDLLAGSSWNPLRFVDLCQETSEGRFTNRPLLERLAAAEYNLLMARILGIERLT